jgi:hypothetical protein
VNARLDSLAGVEVQTAEATIGASARTQDAVPADLTVPMLPGQADADFDGPIVAASQQA